MPALTPWRESKKDGTQDKKENQRSSQAFRALPARLPVPPPPRALLIDPWCPLDPSFLCLCTEHRLRQEVTLQVEGQNHLGWMGMVTP